MYFWTIIYRTWSSDLTIFYEWRATLSTAWYDPVQHVHKLRKLNKCIFKASVDTVFCLTQVNCYFMNEGHDTTLCTHVHKGKLKWRATLSTAWYDTVHACPQGKVEMKGYHEHSMIRHCARMSTRESWTSVYLNQVWMDTANCWAQ
jgi:hypothetical protein